MTEAPTDQVLMPPEGGAQLALLLDLVREVNQGASREAVFARVADALQQIFSIDRFALVLRQKEGLRLALSVGLSSAYVEAAGQQMAEGAGARALTARAPMYIPDATSSPEFWPLQEAATAEGFHTVLILPLFSGAEPLGYLIMYHNTVRVYTPAEVLLAQSLAQQAAFAVQHSRLRTEAEQRRFELEQAFQQRIAEADAIDDILLSISSSLDVESTLHSITHAAANLSGATSASIYLRDDAGLFRATSAYGIALDALQNVVLRPNEGLIAQICETGEPVQVANFRQEVESSTQARDVVAAVDVQATLGVPLLEGNECVGALYVGKNEVTPFTPEAVRTLQRLAAFTQVAVQNAHRFSDVEAERRRLQAYFDAIPEGVIVLDRTGTIVLLNETLSRITGLDRRAVGRSSSEVLSPRAGYTTRPINFRYDRLAVQRRVLATGKPEQGLLELEDPHQIFEVHYSPLRSASDRIDGVVATMRDITVPLELEGQRSRANLLAQLLELSAMLNSDLSVPILTERVVEVAMDLVGAQAGTLGLVEGEKLVFRRFHLSDGWVDFDILISRGQGGPGHVWETMAPYVSNDCAADAIVLQDVRQRMHFRRLVIVPVINRSGTLTGVLGTYDPVVERDFGQRDVEALQLLAHQVAIAIENARLNEVKDSFLSIASHELKTPVTSIKGFAQVLQRKLPADSLETAGRYLEIINQQTDRLTSLINDLLDLSRIQTGRFHFEVAPLDYSQLMREVVAEMQLITPDNEIRLTTPEDVMVLGRGDRLRQILVNLIGNAAEHGPLGGNIQVTVEAGVEWVTTCVRDEGPGLPPGEEERIFGPYYQVQHGSVQPARGLGLGLYISRQVVEGHGGRIWVHSDGHTTFCFTLPAARRER